MSVNFERFFTHVLRVSSICSLSKTQEWINKNPSSDTLDILKPDCLNKNAFLKCLVPNVVRKRL
jgi:hypothetical protein